MNELILKKEHEASGAQFTQYGEWSLPEYYTDPLSEYRAVRERAGVIDLSHGGRYLLFGEDRTTFLQNLISNDIHLAKEGRGIYSTLLTAKGKVIADFYVYPLPGVYLLEMESVAAEQFYAHLMRFKFRSKISIEIPQWGKLLIAGPSAKAVVASLIGCPLPAMQERSMFPQNANPHLIIKRSETGEDDYHLYGHRQGLCDLWATLLTVGKQVGLVPVGQAALEMLRIEAGVPRYGTDIDEEIIPVEAGLEETAISYTKGCYPGQEVVARIKTYGHVNKHLMGLTFVGDDLPHRGDKVLYEGQDAGWVTSRTHSPFLKKPIAMAYLRRSAATPGTAVSVSTDGTALPAVATPLPFYSRGA